MGVLRECEIADLRFLLGATGLRLEGLSRHIARLMDAGYVVAKTEDKGQPGHVVYQLAETGHAAYTASQQTRRKARDVPGPNP